LRHVPRSSAVIPIAPAPTALLTQDRGHLLTHYPLVASGPPLLLLPDTSAIVSLANLALRPALLLGTPLLLLPKASIILLLTHLALLRLALLLGTPLLLLPKPSIILLLTHLALLRL